MSQTATEKSLRTEVSGVVHNRYCHRLEQKVLPNSEEGYESEPRSSIATSQRSMSLNSQSIRHLYIREDVDYSDQAAMRTLRALHKSKTSHKRGPYLDATYIKEDFARASR